ncbi:MAG: hypothetical protein IT364_27530 [Candidatus Hydrogenedentes bacterium]|nr:hypothetical protein [Candidatus Hydrogenedentota bacterium]
MELPALFTYDRWQRLRALASFAAVASVGAMALGFGYAWQSFWLRMFGWSQVAAAAFLWEYVRRLCIRVVVDEKRFLWAQPGWLLRRSSASVLEFPYSEVTLVIRWSYSSNTTDPECFVALENLSCRIPDALPGRDELIQHLRLHIPRIKEEVSDDCMRNRFPLECGVVLHYGRNKRGVAIVAAALFSGLISGFLREHGVEEEGLLNTLTMPFVFMGLTAGALYVLPNFGARVWVELSGLTLRRFGISKRIEFEHLTGVTFKDGLMNERMILRTAGGPVRIYHNLDRYEDLVALIGRVRPDLVDVPEPELPFVLECRPLRVWHFGVLLSAWLALSVGVAVVLTREGQDFSVGFEQAWLSLLFFVPGALAALAYWVMHVERFVFESEFVTRKRTFWATIKPINRLHRIVYVQKDQESRRIVLEFSPTLGKVKIPARATVLPLRTVLEILGKIYPTSKRLVESHDVVRVEPVAPAPIGDAE